MGRTIAIGLDGSRSSDEAFEYALKDLLREGDHIVLIAVVEQPYLINPDFLTAASSVSTLSAEVLQQTIARCEKILRTYGAKLKEKNIPHKEVLRKGGAGYEIVEAIKDEKASLLVVGSRGLGVVKRNILGSVSDYCVHHSHCPVVIVRNHHAQD